MENIDNVLGFSIAYCKDCKNYQNNPNACAECVMVDGSNKSSKFKPKEQKGRKNFMGNKCSLCMNCEYKGRGNFIPPCRFCNNGSYFKNVLLDSIPKKQVRKNSMERRSIRDFMITYCEKCKNNSYECQECTVNISYGQYSVPTKFKPEETIKVPYEKMYDHNANWIADMVNSIDLSLVKIKKIIFSGPATIVFWQDGGVGCGKTIVKYHKEKGCAYRKDLGVLYCIIKHYMCLDNEKQFHKLLKTIDGLCEEDSR